MNEPKRRWRRRRMWTLPSFPCFLKDVSVQSSLAPHVSNPPSLPLRVLCKRKKNTGGGGWGKKWSQLYNTPSLRSSLLQPTTTTGGSTCAAALRSLHRAHRLQSAGMSAGCSDGTAGKCSGTTVFTVLVYGFIPVSHHLPGNWKHKLMSQKVELHTTHEDVV